MSLMDQLTDVVTSQMAGEASKKTGLDAGMVEKLMPMAMAAVMGGLKKNASRPEGAEALSSALDNHDGSLLNDVSRLGGDDVLADGQRMLGHILGGKQQKTEAALSKAAGVDQGQIGQLLAMAAPMVLASLGRAKKEQGLDAAALAGVVNEESVRVQQKAPAEAAGLFQFLDQDGDGDFKDDLMAAAGKRIFGGLFKR